MGLSILLVEDNISFAEVVARHLRKEGHEVDCTATGEEGIRLFSAKSPDIVLLDLMLPGIDGLQVLQQMKSLDEAVPVLVMTAHASVSTAVEAMRLGATDYITKPIDLEALGMKISQAREVLGLKADLRYLLERERRSSGLQRFIGDSPVMQAVYQRIEEVAKTNNTTVLITGPSGTGKEITARAIHALSARCKKPLMQIDCTSIPLTLLESELFGHERGAFTGAERTKKGLLELADGGTLLLDEIGDMELSLQGKFLRVLQEREFRRVGGARDLHFDVRVIAATNQDLDQLAEQGRFRSDLLYRLKVFQIELPALCERGDDILVLAQAFAEQYARAFNRSISGFDPAAREALLSYAFPGNVRELRNIVEQAVILTRGEWITREVLSLPEAARRTASAIPTASPPVFAAVAATSSVPPLAASSSVPSLAASGSAPPTGELSATTLSLEALGSNPLETAERELIRQALQRSAGNKRRAAELLGISRFALQRKLDRFALESLGMSKK